MLLVVDDSDVVVTGCKAAPRTYALTRYVLPLVCEVSTTSGHLKRDCTGVLADTRSIRYLCNSEVYRLHELYGLRRRTVPRTTIDHGDVDGVLATDEASPQVWQRCVVVCSVAYCDCRVVDERSAPPDLEGPILPLACLLVTDCQLVACIVPLVAHLVDVIRPCCRCFQCLLQVLIVELDVQCSISAVTIDVGEYHQPEVCRDWLGYDDCRLVLRTCRIDDVYLIRACRDVRQLRTRRPCYLYIVATVVGLIPLICVRQVSAIGCRLKRSIALADTRQRRRCCIDGKSCICIEGDRTCLRQTCRSCVVREDYTVVCLGLESCEDCRRLPVCCAEHREVGRRTYGLGASVTFLCILLPLLKQCVVVVAACATTCDEGHSTTICCVVYCYLILVRSCQRIKQRDALCLRRTAWMSYGDDCQRERSALRQLGYLAYEIPARRAVREQFCGRRQACRCCLAELVAGILDRRRTTPLERILVDVCLVCLKELVADEVDLHLPAVRITCVVGLYCIPYLRILTYLDVVRIVRCRRADLLLVSCIDVCIAVGIVHVIDTYPIDACPEVLERGTTGVADGRDLLLARTSLPVPVEAVVVDALARDVQRHCSIGTAIARSIGLACKARRDALALCYRDLRRRQEACLRRRRLVGQRRIGYDYPVVARLYLLRATCESSRRGRRACVADDACQLVRRAACRKQYRVFICYLIRTWYRSRR